MVGFVLISILLNVTSWTVTSNVVAFPWYVTVIVCVPTVFNVVSVHVYPVSISFVVPLFYIAFNTNPVVLNVSPS